MVLHEKRALFPKGCFHPVFLATAALMGFFLLRSTSKPLSDFAGYYFGGRELLHGRFAGAYDIEKLNGIIAHAGYHDVFVSYAPFPPFTALVFAPFLGFQPTTARLLFDAFSCLLLLLTLMRARVFLDIPPLPMLLLPAIFYMPIVNNLYFGQSYLLLTALLLEGFIAYRQKKVVLSSLLWGVAVVFKVFPGILLLFLLLKKNYKAALALALACLLLFLLSVSINGWAAWKYYLTEILPKVSNGELNDSFAYLFQSAFMLLKRLFVFDGLLNPHPVTNSPLLFGILLGLYKALILTVCIVTTLRSTRGRPGGFNDFYAFAVWIMGSMLLSPNGSSYSLVLLMIPFFALPETSSSRHVAALILMAACFFPVYKLEGLPALEQFPRLYLLLLFFALLLYPLRPAWHPGWWVGLSVFFIGSFLLGHRRDADQSSYFLAREEHILISDVGVRDGSLVYTYLDGSGYHLQPTGIPVTSATRDSLEVIDKQIYLKGARLTASPDIKKKPLLVDGRYILYLSDKNRGPGFFTLRKLLLPPLGR